MNEIRQLSLFEPKNAFNVDDFNSEVENTGLFESITQGILDAILTVSNCTSSMTLSLRVQGDVIQDIIVGSIENASLSNMVDDKLEVYTTLSGNEKSYIIFKNYWFVIRRKGVKLRDSKVNTTINTQTAENHIITIMYDLDESRENVNMIELQYIKNGCVTYSRSLPTSIDVNEIDNNIPQTEPEQIKPRLKPCLKKKKDDEI